MYVQACARERVRVCLHTHTHTHTYAQRKDTRFLTPAEVSGTRCEAHTEAAVGVPVVGGRGRHRQEGEVRPPPPSAALPPVIEWGDFCPRREDMPGHGPHGLVAWRAPGRPMLGKEVDIILNPGDFSKDLNKKGKHRARLLGMLEQSLHLSHGRWEPRTGFNSFPSPRRV